MENNLVFGEKLAGVHYRTRKAVYAVIFNIDKDKVLTLQTPDGYFWLPGGGIEGTETLETCLKREIIEEMGYDAKVGSFIGQAVQFFTAANLDYIRNEGYFYFAKLLEKTQEPIEHDHFIKWVKVKEINQRLYHKHQSWAVLKGLKG